MPKFKVIDVTPHCMHFGSQKGNPADHPHYDKHVGDYGIETEWEFDTPKEAYDKARELYLAGRKLYGEFQDFIVVRTKS